MLKLFSEKAFWITCLAIMLMGLVGCATSPSPDDPEAVAEFNETNDILEPTNRVIFAFNEFMDEYLLHPSAARYRNNVPDFAQDRISDFLANLKTPVIFVNDVLEGNVTRAGRTTGRFLLNSSFGVLGIMDVGKPLGLPRHEADFGETLGVWGIGEGPYLMLPIFGPSNLRDLVGFGVDSFADPLDEYLRFNDLRYLSYSRFVVGGISLRAAYLDSLDDIKRTSIDYYSTMRSLYRQRREAEINNSINDSSLPPAGFIHLVPKLDGNIYKF